MVCEQNKEETTFRAFFAIDVSNQMKVEIGEIIARLKQEPVCRSIRWTNPKNLHLTLRFLGNITKEQLGSIRGAIAPILQASPAFSLRFLELAPFPRPDFPIALVLKPVPLVELTALALVIDTCVNKFGVKAEKRFFNPHLTVGRIRGKLPIKKLFAALSKMALPKLALDVSCVKLLRSEPSAQGSNYTELGEFMLAKSKSN